MDSVRTFRLGQVIEPLPGHEMMTGRIVIPYIKKLAVVGLKFRCISGHDCKAEKCPKYLNDGNQWLFNTTALDVPSSFVSIAEGELDAIILSQCGIPSVGIPGVDAWKSHEWWPELFKGHRKVLIYADNDTSKDKNYGHDLAKRIMHDVPRARLVTLPEDSDVTDTYLDYGPQELYARAGLVDMALAA